MRLLLIPHGQEPLLMSARAQAAEPLSSLGGGEGLQSLVLRPVAHDLLQSCLPGRSVLLGNHVVAVGLALACDLLDGNAVGKTDLCLGKATRVGGNDGNPTQLSLSHDDAPSLIPQRRSQEDLDAIPDIVGILRGWLDPSSNDALACL